MEEEIPQTFEEKIIYYLRSHEIPCENDLSFSVVDKVPPEEDIAVILDEILYKVLKRISCKDKYENTKLLHNQYPLFDLSYIIPDFCVDEDLISKLCFKESVLISEIDSYCGLREVEPKSVGGLSLNIECVLGYIPEDRELSFEKKLQKKVVKILKKTKDTRFEMKSHDFHTEKTDFDELLEYKLKNYEDFLNNQMKKNCKKFVVHLSSQFEVDGRNAGSSLTSWIDRNFHTLEERRTEFIEEIDKALTEKTLYVSLQKEKYYIHYKSNDCEEKKYYSLVKTKDMVSEGANLILMRYLAIIKYSGSFELSTPYINGDMCRNIYECIGATTGIINDKEVEICKIYRYIIEECGIEHHCVTVLTVDGYIISQEWEGCNYILNRNPVLFLGKGPLQYERKILSKTWIDDIELLSRYLDYKTVAEMKMKKYIFDHQEVKELLADYVNSIVLLKPENVLSFTMDYFQSIYPFKLPRQSYFEPDD